MGRTVGGPCGQSPSLASPPRPPQAAQHSEPCYANLELQTWALLEDPLQPEQVEVEYSTVVSVRAGSGTGTLGQAGGVTVGVVRRSGVFLRQSHAGNGAGVDFARS